MMTFKQFRTIVYEAAINWREDNAPRLSAALAFYTILSLAPLFLIAIAIVGAVYGRDAATGALTEQLESWIGSAGAEIVRITVHKADHPKQGIIATVVGLLTLLFAASGVFGELKSSLNVTWNVKPKPDRGFWVFVRGRFLSFGMVLVIGFLLLVSMVHTTSMTAFGSYLDAYVPGLSMLIRWANFVMNFAIITCLFAMIFKWLPDAIIHWRDVWFGATITAILFSIGNYLIAFYLKQGGMASPFGAAGSLVAFIIWVYYSGLILFFGAELTQVTARHAGREILPGENAVSTLLPGETKDVEAASH